METILWRPEPNPLTTPKSCRIRFIPRNTASIKDIAADIAIEYPNYNKALAESILEIAQQKILQRLINGENVTFKNAFTYTLSFTGRLETPDDPLPPLSECLHIRIHAARAMTEALCYEAHTERLPPEQRQPEIETAQDTLLGLSNVLDPNGALQLTGEDLYFDNSLGMGQCVIQGTRSGETVQSRFVKIEDKEVIIMPSVPAQTDPWNNEYTISLSIRYSEHGTLRTGIYQQMLRTPIAVPGLGQPIPPETGILTGNSALAYVSINAGTLTADERLRVQAVLDLLEDRLLLNLLDMQEGGVQGTVVEVNQDGEYILPGFSGSAVSSLEITVNDYAGLRAMVRDDYESRLVDILDVSLA